MLSGWKGIEEQVKRNPVQGVGAVVGVGHVHGARVLVERGIHGNVHGVIHGLLPARDIGPGRIQADRSREKENRRR